MKVFNCSICEAHSNTNYYSLRVKLHICPPVRAITITSHIFNLLGAAMCTVGSPCNTIWTQTFYAPQRVAGCIYASCTPTTRLTFRPLSAHLLKHSCSKSGTNKLHEKSKGPVNTYTHSRRNTHNLPHPLIQAQLQYSRRGHTSESIGPHVNTSPISELGGGEFLEGGLIRPFGINLFTV